MIKVFIPILISWSIISTVSCSPTPQVDNGASEEGLNNIQALYSDGPPTLSKVNAAFFQQDGSSPISIWPPISSSMSTSDDGSCWQGDYSFYDSTFQIGFNNTCSQSRILHIDRALSELHQLVFSATTTLLQDPKSDINRLYWGPLNSTDRSTPTGVFGQVLFGDKSEISITCQEDNDRCVEKTVSDIGGYVDEVNGAIHLCNSVFEDETKCKYIEDICTNDSTLSDNKPLQFWSPLLLKLLLELPQITHNSLLNSTDILYADVLRSARVDTLAPTNNIYTYLYFMLDNVAQQYLDGGCRGIEEKNIEIHEAQDKPQDEIQNDNQEA